MSQMNLLNVPITSDVVYTPDWVARDIVEWFKPSGRILEPAAGDGAFLRHMPSAEWCELERGRDFFQWVEPVDWIVSNPPYSVFAEFLRHAMTVAENIVFLIPVNKPFNSMKIMRDIFEWGGIVHCRLVAGGAAIGFPIGFAIGSMHFRRGHTGGMTVSFAKVTA